jgi:hypothetical protein
LHQELAKCTQRVIFAWLGGVTLPLGPANAGGPLVSMPLLPDSDSVGKFPHQFSLCPNCPL